MMEARGASHLEPWPVRRVSSLPVVIGLVNNMPEAEFDTTEERFRKLLFAAMPPGTAMELRLFTIEDVPRSPASRAQIAKRYETTDMLWTAGLDGLIVSGLEPRMASLTTEPYWPTLTRIFDWATHHTRSAIFSCLAAHAAVLHFDGIERQALPEKLSGVFDCDKSSDALSWTEMPESWAFPHSRHNGLSREDLVAEGYQIVSSAPSIGVDIFEKQIGSRITFMQGHPEYDVGALAREYRRDVRRFLTGKRDIYPTIPVGYFDQATEARLQDFRDRAHRNRRPDLSFELPDTPEDLLLYRWREPAVGFYKQWFASLLDSLATTGVKHALGNGSVLRSQSPSRSRVLT